MPGANDNASNVNVICYFFWLELTSLKLFLKIHGVFQVFN
jgi:hypothetical protein